jgi:TRAP-type C4-dicarboxylate transport system permease small subunit
VRLPRPRIGLANAALLWYGLFGAPFAWTIQHVAGVGFTEASCQEAAKHGWSISLDAWTIVFSAGAVIVTLGALAAALETWRRTKDVGTDPPGARVHFLSIIALTTTPLFLAIMVMSGLGVLFLGACRQS